MIRIFISALLYLISFFTQAQTDTNQKDHELVIKGKGVTVSTANNVDSIKTASLEDWITQSNQVVKFEVNDKDLTFEIN